MGPKAIGITIVAVVLGIIGLGAAFGSFYTVDQQDRGVILRNGKLVGIAEPGFNWKMPFVTEVKEIPVTSQNKSYQHLQAYSRDQQVANMNVSVSFAVPPGKVGELYSMFGSIDNLTARAMDRQVPQAMENVFGQYNAITAVQERVRLVADLNAAVKTALEAYPVVVESVQLENVSFSDSYDAAISQRMEAEVAVTKRKQDLEAERITAQIAVTTAQGKADSQLAEATAAAKATRLQGEADAYAIKAKSDALNNVNPNLVAYTIATTWNGKLPETMVPGQAVPFIPFKAINQQ